MVWAGIIGDSIIGPYFFEGNVTGNSYLDLLGNFVLPELHRLNIDPQNIWYQHDGAAPHYAVAVRGFLDGVFRSWIGRGGPVAWPARSPDLNPCDLFLWPYLKDKVSRAAPNNIDELKEKIRHEIEQITPAVLANVRNNLSRRLRKCLMENGDHITNQ